MKRIVFITKSKLSQNLMDLIIKSIPKKIELKCINSLEELELASFSKTIHILIMDNNILANLNTSDFSRLECLESRYLLKAKKIFMHERNTQINRDKLGKYGFQQLLTKPFLPEELVDFIQNNLGGHA